MSPGFSPLTFMTHTGKIERPRHRSDRAGGGVVTAWTLVGSGIPSCIQTLSARDLNWCAQRRIEADGKVYLDGLHTLEPGDRYTETVSERRFIIMGWRDPAEQNVYMIVYVKEVKPSTRQDQD